MCYFENNNVVKSVMVELGLSVFGTFQSRRNRDWKNPKFVILDFDIREGQTLLSSKAIKMHYCLKQSLKLIKYFKNSNFINKLN